MVANGANHWDASLLVLGNGDLLVLETLEGPGGTTQGKITSIRSTDGGLSWGSPVIIYDEPGEETYPVAVQKFDGVIHLMFRDPNHSATMQIGQLWSGDNAYTWSGHSVFSNSSPAKQFSFIGSQGGQNLTVLASIFSGAVWQVHHWTSWDNGLTWEGPYLTPATTSQSTGDAEFSMGCRGITITYSAPSPARFLARRYDANPWCIP